jgi:hypothetical protein
MGHPSLKIDTSKLKDLLDDAHYTKCLNCYIEFTQQRIPVWLTNIAEQNAKEWITLIDKQPVTNFDGYYESKMPSDIIQMIGQEVSIFDLNIQYVIPCLIFISRIARSIKPYS